MKTRKNQEASVKAESTECQVICLEYRLSESNNEMWKAKKK